MNRDSSGSDTTGDGARSSGSVDGPGAADGPGSGDGAREAVREEEAVDGDGGSTGTRASCISKSLTASNTL